MRVSFIVPLYNVAPYIERCARSLFSQTLESCEFVFVDDCSTDGSFELLMELVSHEFSHLQSRITLVRHASNLGVSESRNTALTTAKGQFVIFVDGDDWVDPQLAEELFIEQLVDNSDMVFSSFYRVSNGANSLVKSRLIGGRMGTLQVVASQSFAFENRIWGVLIRRSLIVNNSLAFDPRLSMGEDFLFLTQLLYHARRISHCAKPLYSYRAVSVNSAMQTITRKRQISYIRAQKSVEQFLTLQRDGGDFRSSIKLMQLNLGKWLLLRHGRAMQPRTLLLRCYMLTINTIWWLRWRLFA